MNNSQKNQVVMEDHVFLAGRPPMGEYLGFLTQHLTDSSQYDYGVLASEWRAANDHIRELEKTEMGWADNPKVVSLDHSFTELKDKVLNDPAYKRSFSIVPTEIGVVELDRLIVFQKFINLDYVKRLRERLGVKPTKEGIFQFCLPWDHPQPEVKSSRSGLNSYVFMSPSKDFRFIEPALATGEQFSNYRQQGPVSAVIGLVVGFGSNFLNAIHVENRLVLNNGSHRSFALREAGITHVPCIIQRVSRREELEVIATQDLVKNLDLFLKNPRPPVLKDYFDSKLRKVIPVPRQLRQVRVSFGIESIDVPG